MSDCFFIKFRNGFSKFILWKIFFFSIIPFASAGIIDKGYESLETVIDQGFLTILPIFYYFFASVNPLDGNNNIWLPIWDDALYNAVTWLIPLIVSYIYDDLLIVKNFSLANMIVHLICVVFSYGHMFRNGTDWAKVTVKKVKDEKSVKSFLIPLFIIFFPVMVIPGFWIFYIYKNYGLDSTSSIVFLTLFGFLLFFNFILWYIFLGISTYIIDKIDIPVSTEGVVLTILLTCLPFIPPILAAYFSPDHYDRYPKFVKSFFLILLKIEVGYVIFASLLVLIKIGSKILVEILRTICKIIVGFWKNYPKTTDFLIMVHFHGPNVLQVLFIVLKLPINTYFVKLWMTILVLSLRRSADYYTSKDKKVPDNFIATSTTYAQYCMCEWVFDSEGSGGIEGIMKKLWGRRNSGESDNSNLIESENSNLIESDNILTSYGAVRFSINTKNVQEVLPK